MAGHNKWKQIKDKKAKTDAVKARIYSKYAKLISDEAKKANGDRTAPALRSAIDRAKSENTPNDVIERAIRKATEAGSKPMESIIYEAYGPGGSALIIHALTDNRNKAAQEIKAILTKNGFELATPGSAMWAFEKTSEGFAPKTTTDLEDTDLELLDKLVENLEENNEVQEVFTNVL